MFHRALAAASLLVGVLAVDLINYEYIDTVWDYPAWTVALVGTAFISLSLKALAIKLVIFILLAQFSLCCCVFIEMKGRGGGE